MKQSIVCGVLGAAALFLQAFPASAQTFPERTIRLIVNVNAGGVTDTLARIVGQGLGELWGKPVIVENRAGGNSAIAAQAVTREAPDGHTLLVTADNTFTGNPSLVKNLGYSFDDFTPIAIVCRIVPVLAVPKSIEAKTLPEFIELMRSKPGAFNFGSQGPGSYAHLGMEDLIRKTSIKMVHVPYRGGAPAIEGLVRGDVASLIINYSNIQPFEESGAVRILAIANDKRYPARPELPTISEAAVPGYSVSTWFGIFGPAKLPAEIRQTLATSISSALGTPKAKDYFAKNSCERMDLTPEQITTLVSDDAKHWGALVKAAGLNTE